MSIIFTLLALCMTLIAAQSAFAQGSSIDSPFGNSSVQSGAVSPPNGWKCPRNRYIDCGNGTVTDTVGGLIWLADANCFGSQNWANANTLAVALANGQCGLSDGSAAGGCRLLRSGRR